MAERKKNCSFPSLENFNGCSDLQVCKSATVGPALTKRWNPYNKNHIKEAKRRGLSCGNATGDSKTTAEKKYCHYDVNVCTQKELCQKATKDTGEFIKRIWNDSSYWKAHVAEAKRRGLTCGVTETVAKKKTCSQDVRECNASELCNRSTYTNGTKGTKAWKVAGKHVTEAKRQGLSCGVTGSTGSTTASSTAATTTPNYSNRTAINYSFRNETVLRRKQIQYALKRLNYYTSSIDAQYGPRTERAIIAYAKSKRLSTNNPSAIFSSVLSQVSVPSSFAVAKRSNNSSSSSSSSSSGGSSAGRTLLQGLFVAGACSLTSNPGACLDGATGNNRSSNTRSSPPKTLSSGTWIKSGNTYIGPGGEVVFDNGRVIQGTDGSLCHRTRNAIICQ
mgnify:CR=1 FL=1